MIKMGIVSVSFRKKSVEEVIDIVKKAGLSVIEWGSDVHVPQGEVELANEVREKTLAAGLEIPSYGSYYHLGSNGDFAPFIESAKALGAPNIRVWAGKIASAVISDEDRANIVADARRVCDMAAKEGITISVEYHNDSMTDSADADIAFLNMVDHDNFYTYWQQPLELTDDEQLPELKKVVNYGRLKNAHAFQYRRNAEGGLEKLPLNGELWADYVKAIATHPGDHCVLIEFVSGYTDEEFFADAKTLLSL